MVPLELLRNHIDITEVPFSDRGSRLLICKTPTRNSFYIKLAERLIFLDSQIESYLDRPPFINDLCLLDESGKALDFEITTYPHKLIIETHIGEFSIVFQDENTLSFGLPAGQNAGIRFQLKAKKFRTNDKGGNISAVRELCYRSNAEPLVNRIDRGMDSCRVDFRILSGNNTAITLSIGEKDLTTEVLPFSRVVKKAKNRWRDWFCNVPLVAEKHRKTYMYAWWIMANNLISARGEVLFEAMVPSKTKYIGLWLWDSALHALAYRHIDPILAQNQIRAMLAHQLDDGMLPDAVHDEGVVSEIGHPIKAAVTKPPILAWAVLKLHESNPDVDFLNEIYTPLKRWNAWWFNSSDGEANDLARYNHPYSSGLDDNPLWDYGMPVKSPDLNTYLSLQMDSLAQIAKILGNQEEADMWRQKSCLIANRMIEELWDENSGVFRAYHDGKAIPVLTPFNLYPLWSGLLPDNMRERLLTHLVNSGEFWGKYILPSVARNDKHFNADIMWRGPVWANINYFFIEALQKVGEVKLAKELRDKTLEMIMAHPGIYEYYNAETGYPGKEAAPIFGWTAAVFIELAIQAYQEQK